MRAGRQNRSLFPFTSDPTFCPREAHHKSRSETNGGLCSDRCSFSLSPIHSKKRFTRSIIATAGSVRQLPDETQRDQVVNAFAMSAASVTANMKNSANAL